jgi:ATPase family associated with various cellular activities (AAA)
MSTQPIFAQDPQSPFGFAEDSQPAIAFPLTLAEKYQPRLLDDLVGLDAPRRLLNTLVKAPRPCAMLFVGNPGVGKSVAGLCFADTMGASLVHISAQKCDVATLDSLRDRFAYHPPKGKFWVCLVDEADQMTEKAQVQLLSRLDATASLVVGMGGASTRASQPPIIWIFTANGTGPAGIIPPSSLEKRFLSRCMVIPFEPLEEDQLSLYLRDVWGRETDLDATNAYFDYLARGGGVRESLMRMQVDILTGAPRPIPAPVSQPLAVHREPANNPVTPAPGRYIPQWKRVYGGPVGNQLNHVAKLLTAHNFEIIAKDDRSNARARAQKLQCVLVRRDAYAAAMQLVAEKG